MDVREKFVELIDRAHHNASCVIGYDGSEGEAIEEEVRYLIANGVTIQEWIPVSERLPQDMQERVLVTTDCDTPVGNQKIDTDRFRNGEWVRYGSHVTHWMPLPQPPKGE